MSKVAAKRLALKREICILANRVHGKGLVSIDQFSLSVSVGDCEVARVMPLLRTTANDRLARLVDVLITQAARKGINTEGVKFSCTSNR